MTKSLYERLGKTEGIGRIVDDVMAAHLRNPIIKMRYESVDDIEHATKMAAEFFENRRGAALSSSVISPDRDGERK